MRARSKKMRLTAAQTYQKFWFKTAQLKISILYRWDLVFTCINRKYQYVT